MEIRFIQTKIEEGEIKIKKLLLEIEKTKGYIKALKEMQNPNLSDISKDIAVTEI